MLIHVWITHYTHTNFSQHIYFISVHVQKLQYNAIELELKVKEHSEKYCLFFISVLSGNFFSYFSLLLLVFWSYYFPQTIVHLPEPVLCKVFFIKVLLFIKTLQVFGYDEVKIRRYIYLL